MEQFSETDLLRRDLARTIEEVRRHPQTLDTLAEFVGELLPVLAVALKEKIRELDDSLPPSSHYTALESKVAQLERKVARLDLQLAQALPPMWSGNPPDDMLPLN